MEKQESCTYTFQFDKSFECVTAIAMSKKADHFLANFRKEGQWKDIEHLETGEYELLIGTLKSFITHLENNLDAAREVQRVRKELGL